MKKYFFYSISVIIIIIFLGSVLNFSQEITNDSFVRAQFDGGGNGFGNGFGGGNGDSDYDIDYDGDCEAVYCYAARNTQPCPDDAEIKENQKRIVDLRDVILYYRNRALAEDKDLKEDIEKVINVKLKWFEDKIAAEKKVLEQCENEACRKFQQAIIESLEKDKKELEREKDYKQALRVKLDELARAIKKIEEPTIKLAALPDQCLANVKEQCSGSCKGGCHDEKECAPDGCSGDNPCPMSEIEDKVSEINSINDDIRKIADEIIDLVSKIKEVEAGPPSEEICDDPRKLAEQNNVPYPRKRAASVESLLSCISREIGQPLPGEGGSNQFYGSLYTYEHQNELCNYTRGRRTCGNCAHAIYSCHYGGTSGSDGALAIDFGNERNGDRIIQAAIRCGAKSARCEDSAGQTVNCAGANHIHITDRNCDRN